MTFIIKTARYLSKKIGIIIPFIVFLFLIFSVFNEWDRLKEFPWSINPLWIISSLIAYTIQLLIMFYIWHLIMINITGQGNLILNIKAFFYSSLAKRIPTVVPYLGVRYHIYKTKSPSESSSAIFGSLLEVFVLIISGGIFISFCGLVFNTAVLLYRYTWIVSMIIGIFILYPKGFTSFFNYFRKRSGRETIFTLISPKLLFLLVGESLITYAINAIAIFCLINGISEQYTPIQDTIIASSVYYLLTYVTMYLVGGFGIKEMVFGLMLRDYLIFPAGVIIAFVIRLMMIFVEALMFLAVRQIFKSESSSG